MCCTMHASDSVEKNFQFGVRGSMASDGDVVIHARNVCKQTSVSWQEPERLVVIGVVGALKAGGRLPASAADSTV